MRGTRWLLLVAIVAILSGLGLTYRAQKQALRAQSPPRPEALAADLNSKSQGFSYSRTNSDHTTVEVCADDMKEVKDSVRLDLKGVTLKLYNKTGDAYDLVKSADATLYKAEQRFYSEGEVEITLAIPKPARPSARPSRSSPPASTSTPAPARPTPTAPPASPSRTATGSATGAFYDPATRVLNLKQDVNSTGSPSARTPSR